MAEEPNKDSPPPPIRVEIEQAATFLNEYRSNERENRIREDRRLLLELLTLIALLIYATLVFIQWQEMKLSNTLTQFALNDGAMRAREASIETRKGLELTRQANEGAQRAWLTVKGATVHDNFIGVGTRAEIQVTVENTGRSPAQNVLSTAATAFRRTGWVIPQQLPEPSDNKSLTVTGPGQGLQVKFHREKALTPEEVAGLANGTFTLYYVGHLTYADQFSTDRALRFCFFYDPPRSQLSICSQKGSSFVR